MQRKPSNPPGAVHHASATAANRGKMGEHAEGLACAHLVRHGLTLLQRNYRCVRGEIDLIMGEGASLVFVEVRYRHKPWFGSGAESVTRHKRAKLIATASHYLQ